MSNSSYLQKMRKSDLAKMAESLQLDYEGLKKSQLEIIIEQELNQYPHFAADSRYAGFFKKRLSDTATPVKREVVSAGEGVADTVTKATRGARRRVTEKVEEAVSAVEESEIEAPIARTRALASRTPNRVRELAAQVPLPPSPSVVTDVIERRTQDVLTKINTLASNSGVIEAAESTRDVASSLISIEACILFLEAYYLRPEILENRYAFDFPSIPFIANEPCPVYVPDFFLLLTARFWSPFVLWAATSVFVPLVVSYFFNLTGRTRRGERRFEYRVDPLVFNIVKAVITYAVYAQDVTFGGLVDLESVARIRSAVAGGWQGIVAGAAVGALCTMYEAIIRK